MRSSLKTTSSRELSRPKLIDWLVLGFFSLVAIRLVQIQILEHGDYEKQAKDEHSRLWELKADRGTIYIRDGSGIVPLAMNTTVYNLAASPKDFRENTSDVADKIASAVGADSTKLKELLNGKKSSGYVGLLTRLDRLQAKKIKALDIYGLFLEPVPQREYPEGELAGQVLGFVNAEGKGQYGVEQYYNQELGGKTGLLKSVATASGDPLLLPGDKESVDVPAEQGKDITLSLDRGLQSRLEDIAKAKNQEYGSDSVSILILDANTGKVKAMAGAPSYNPAEYFKTENIDLFKNRNVADAEELGSIIKVLTMTSGLNEGVVNKNTTYYNSGSVKVGDRVIENATPGHTGTISMTEVLKYSLNTGVVYVLQQLGGGSINEQAENKLYDYFYSRFKFGQRTGIDLAGEETGIIYAPQDQEGNAVRYSNMTFGQGMTVTPIQAASALAAAVNGGRYIVPTVVDKIGDKDTEPNVLNGSVVNPETSENLKDMMSQVGYLPKVPGYRLGGKTGTAQLLSPDGTYSDIKERGTAYGFIETGEGLFIFVIKVEDPDLVRFAGTKTAVPIMVESMNWFLDYYKPKPLQ